MMAKPDPVGPRTRRARHWMTFAFFLSLLLGAGLLFGSDRTHVGPLGDGPIDRTVAAALIAVWVVYFLVSWLWWRNVDEHEAKAYNFGAVVAIHVYFFIVPAWWVAWRAGFVPEPQHMAMVLVTALVWSAGWFWRRYR
jgi:hypothetical protein